MVGSARCGQNLYPIPDNEETAPWTEWQSAAYGFADLTIADGTSATIRYLSALQDGVVLHSQTLTRTLPRLPVPQQ
jgi:Iron/zinc purple acid phosphatase-like protein C